MGHFSKECRAQRNQDGRFRNQDNSRKQGNNEDTYSKAMMAIDGVVFYWSDMAEEQTLLKIPRKDNMYSFDMKNIVPKESLTCLVAKATLDKSLLWHRRLGHINFKNINKLVQENLVRGLPIKRFENNQTCVACLKGKQQRACCIKREYIVTRTPQHNGFTERRNRTLIEAARTMLADSKLPTTFWAKAVSTACYVQNRFDGKSYEGFFVGYSLSIKAFRVYNTRTKKVVENLHIGFLEINPMKEGNGPKWLFDIDSLSQSMNYVPVVPGTILDASACTHRDRNACTSSWKEATSQDYIMMPIWKDASYFDTPSKDVEEGTHNENDEKDKFEDDSSPKDVNAAGQHVNTASLKVNTCYFKHNTVDPSLNTASSSDPHSPTNMFNLGASDTLEATQVEFF
nr:ribonuclease H-like domain-containing protein [Tanacetum cinerariifolium]